MPLECPPSDYCQRNCHAYNDKQLQLTVSIGVTTLQTDDTLHTLLSRADHAMYRASKPAVTAPAWKCHTPVMNSPK
jgi:GGDEF domain-containing protein